MYFSNMPITGRPRVVVASVQGRATLPDEGALRIESVADVTYVPCPEGLTRQAAASVFAGAEVVAFTPKVAPPVDEPLLAALPGLRGIALYATGYDFLDLELLHRYGVVLSHLPEYSTVSVAEHALGLLLTLSRRIHLANDRSRALVPQGTSLRGFELAGRILGVIGLGRIGSRFTQLGRALGMQVLAADPREGRAVPEGVTVVTHDELLERADAVVVLCSATYGSGPVVGPLELATMRRGSVLVNASRASLVDTDAVAAALRCGWLRGYAVDDAVFDRKAHGDLLAEGRAVQTGHSAWWSDEVLVRGGALWAESIRRLAIDRPVNVVRGDPGVPEGVLDGSEVAEPC